MVGILTLSFTHTGLIAGASLMAGAFIAKRFVLQMKPESFRLIMDGIMLAAGTALLWSAALHRRPHFVETNRHHQTRSGLRPGDIQADASTSA